MRQEPVLVVGGGIVGLSCAWRLRQAGADVRVVDPGRPEERSSWAAGGMLAPLSEAPDPGPFLRVAQASLERYPDFVAELESASELRLGLHLNGKLLTASDEPGLAALRRRHAWQARDGHPVQWLDGEGVRNLEPAVGPAVQGGLLLRGNGRVDNRRLVEGLQVALDRAGVRRVRGRALAVDTTGGAVTGLRLRDGTTLTGGFVVLAAGAWSAGIQGLPRPLPVRPVRGQMLALGLERPLLNRVVTSPDVYLIPRDTPAGPILVLGATEEEAGFDLTVDGRGQDALRAAACRLVPELSRAPVVERWAGLRPGTPDDLPVLGPDPDVDGLCYATGHYRNGILLAPVTAERVVACWKGEAPAPGVSPWSRFLPRRLA